MKKEELEELGKAVSTMIDKKEEDVELMNKLITVIKNYKDMDEALSSFFVNTILMDILQKLMQISSCSKIEFQISLADVLRLYLPILYEELPKGNIDTILKAKPLFDYESSLYQNALNDIKASIESAYNPDISPTWREELKAGDLIDAIAEDRNDMIHFKGWTLARIFSQSTKQIEVEYIGNPKYGKNSFTRLSKNIAPKNSRGGDYDWRNQLKEGDRVDAIDNQSIWYLSTVMSTRGKPGVNKEVYIGYRVYIPDGTKKDKNGRAHEGWSETYDEWLPVFSLRIQKPNSITKLGTIYCRRNLDSEAGAVDDSSDVLLNWPVEKEELFVAHRYYKDSSSLYLELMTEFGKIGGFMKIYETFKTIYEEQKERMHVRLVFAYLNLLTAPHPVYHRYYVIKLIHPFLHLVIKYMNSLPDIELRNATREVVDQALNQIELLARRVYTSKTKGEVTIKLKIGIALSLLQSEILERRIQAVRLVSDTCKQAKEAQLASSDAHLPTANDNIVLRGVLQVPRILKEIFGERSHIQLIQRSAEIFKFFLLNSNISKEDFTMIWECFLKDEQSKIEILKVWCEIGHWLSNDLISMILEKYEKMDKSFFLDQDISLMLELGSQSAKTAGKSLERLLDIMWKVIRKEISNIGQDLYERIIERFCDLVTTPSRVSGRIYKDYLEQLYVMMLEEDQSTVAMKILRKSLVQYPKNEGVRSKTEMIGGLLKEGEVLRNYFTHFEQYKTKAANLHATNQLKENEHIKDLTERKEFLLFMIKNAGFKLNFESLDFLWNMLVLKAVTSSDQAIFYKFLKELFSQGVIVDYFATAKDVSLFFEKVICDDKNDFSMLPVEGIQAIEMLLIFVNKQQKKLISKEVIPRGGKRGQPVGPKEQQKPGPTEDFIVEVQPKEITGLNTLWKIVMEAKNESANAKCIEFLNKIYTQISPKLDELMPEISTQFIETVLSNINIFLEESQKLKIDKSKEIIKLLKLIEEMIDVSERNGNGGITPFYGLFKGESLKLKILNLTNKIQNAQELVLDVHNKVTFWQLKMLLSYHVKIPPASLRLIFPNTFPEEKDYSKTLEEIKLYNNNVIKLVRKIEEHHEIPLLNNLGKLTDKARAVFVEIFNQFAVEEKMTPKELAAFCRACLANPRISEKDNIIISTINNHDAEKKGYLSLDNFLTFYEFSIHEKESVARKNLSNLGYGPDLAPKDFSLSSIKPDFYLIKKLPRYTFSNTSKYLHSLFALLNTNIAPQAMHLIFRLSPSENLVQQVLGIWKVDSGLDSLFSISHPYQSMYSLYLARSLLENNSESPLLEIRNEVPADLRREWRENFLKNNGVAWIINQMEAIKDSINENGISTYTKILLQILSVSLLGSAQNLEKFQTPVSQFGFVKETTYIKPKVDGNEEERVISFVKKKHISLVIENDLQEYTEYTDLLKEHSVISSIDLPHLALKLWQLFECISDTRHKFDPISKKIAITLSSLIRVIYFYNPSLYTALKDKIDVNKILIFGVLSNVEELRDIYQELIYFISANVKDNTSKPIYEFLEEMLDLKKILAEEKCGQYCEVLMMLLEIVHNNHDEILDKFDIQAKLEDFLTYLFKIKSNEKIDSTLTGVLQITDKLLAISGLSKHIDPIKLIEEIYINFLFPVGSSETYICESATSRAAAFQLLLTLACQSERTSIFFVKNCLKKLDRFDANIKKWSHIPERQKKSSSGFVGLVNLGAICFMNSVLQQLFLVEPFRNALVSISEVAEWKAEKKEDNLLYQLQIMYGYLLFSIRRDFNPKNFCFSYKELDGSPLDTTIQRDAHEFINIFFDRLEERLKKTSYPHLLRSIFGGKNCSQTICPKCGNISSTFEDYFYLSLEIKNLKTLYEALEKYISKTSVSGYKCDACKNTVEVIKRNIISTLPSVLLVHLQRFSFDFDTLRNEKINTRLEFPNVLDVMPYTEEGIDNRSQEPKSEEYQKASSELEMKDKKDQEGTGKTQRKIKPLRPASYYQYKLVGVVVHNGTAEGGHYYSYINVARREHDKTSKDSSENYMKTELDRWVVFDDSSIREFDFTKLEAECFGGPGSAEDRAALLEEIPEAEAFMDSSKSAYILVYEKEEKLPIPEKVKETIDLPIVESLENIQRENYEKVVFRDSENQLYKLHPFYHVPRCINEQIINEIKEDNYRFVFENLIYHTTFAKFICECFFRLCTLVKQSSDSDYKGEIKPLLQQLGEHYGIDVLPRANLNSLEELEYMGKGMEILLENDQKYAVSLLNLFIDHPTKLKDLVACCPEKKVRQYIVKILSKAFNVILEDMPKNTDIAYKFVDFSINCIGNDLGMLWTKFREFFELLCYICKQEQIVEYCFKEKDLIAVLLDFFLEKKSPFYNSATKRYEMGSQSYFPDFSPLIELVSELICYAKLVRLSKGKIEIIEESPVGKGKERYVLSDRVNKCLLFEEIIEKHMKCHGTGEEISKLMIHLTFENKQNSIKFCEFILKGLNDFYIEKAEKYLSLAEQQLALVDSFQEKRIEWILGFQQPICKMHFGLQLIADMKEEVNTYISSISSMLHHEPLLEVVYKSRNRPEAFVLAGILVILRAMKKNPAVFNYMKTIPAPAYIYSSYIDWMDVHIYNEPAHSIEKRKLQSEAIALIDELIDLIKPTPKPQPYMIGREYHERELHFKEDKKGVKINCTEVITEIFPNNGHQGQNTILDLPYLISHFQHRQSSTVNLVKKRRIIIDANHQKNDEKKESAKKDDDSKPPASAEAKMQELEEQGEKRKVEESKKEKAGSIPSKEETTHSKNEIMPLKEETTHSKEEIIPPKEDKTLPKEEKIHPKVEMVHPKEEAIPPQKEIISPQEKTIPPQKEQMPPQKEAIPPQEKIMPSQKETIPFKEEQIFPQEKTISPQKEQMPPQKEAIPPQEKILPPKEEQIPLKEEQIPPKEEQTHLQEKTISPQKEAIPPQEKTLPPKEEQIPPKKEQIPPKEEKIPPQKETIPPQKEIIPPQEKTIPPKEEEVPPKEEKRPPQKDSKPTDNNNNVYPEKEDKSQNGKKQSVPTKPNEEEKTITNISKQAKEKIASPEKKTEIARVANPKQIVEMTKAAAILKIDIRSYSSYAGNISIKIKPKVGATPNFYVPKNKIVKNIYNGYFFTVLYLQKEDVTQNWGEFNIILKFLDEPVVAPVHHQQPAPSISAKSDSYKKAQDEEISCPSCTLLNPSYAIACSLCGAQLSKAKRGLI